MGNVDGGAMSCGRGSHGHRVAGEGSPATTPETIGPAGGVPLPTPGGTAPVYDVGGVVPGVVPLAEILDRLDKLGRLDRLDRLDHLEGPHG